MWGISRGTSLAHGFRQIELRVVVAMIGLVSEIAVLNLLG
jgi:hypothetical protein